MLGQLIFEYKTQFEGKSFGAQKSIAGEVVFTTGMVGYPESLTDPSYLGQILVLTYPIVGNYGVPDPKFFESGGIKVSGLVVSNYIDTPSHHQSKITLSNWLKKENIPALEIKDTRFLAQKIREKGTMLGKIILNEENVDFYDPNKENLVAKVSTTRLNLVQGSTLRGKTVLLIDCGAKRNIQRRLLKRGVNVITVPWDFNPFFPAPDTLGTLEFDGIVISNGPGDPKIADRTIETVKVALQRKIPVLGICLGNQILALAAGGDTYKLKFGHRSQNQPCIMNNTKRCYITVQNHGFAVGKIPAGFRPWFTNANDQTNEGIIHEKLPFMSVQFHPEANPGPSDTEWIFDYFLERLMSS